MRIMSEKRNTAENRLRPKSSDYSKRSTVASANITDNALYTKQNTGTNINSTGNANKRSQSSSSGGRARQMIENSRSFDSDNNSHPYACARNDIINDQVGFSRGKLSLKNLAVLLS